MVTAEVKSFIVAGNVKKWRLAEVQILPRWISKSGRVVVIGDAAHGIYPNLAQRAAMATEDALALTECVGRAKTTSQIPEVLKAFERSRKWRCEIMQAQSRRGGDVLHVADGVEQEERDKRMAGLPVDETFWDVDIGPLIESKFRGFLFGYNVMDHTTKLLAEMPL